MMETVKHEQCVRAWLAASASCDADHSAMRALLLAGLRAVWDRARPSLGDVTLSAIFKRAIHTAERRHPDLAQLGLHIDERGSIELTSASAPRIELHEPVVCVLVEVMRAIARLTADGLTQALHAALSSATIDEPRALVLLRPPLARCDSRDERGTP
jgi:hypothetical protein